MAAIAVAASVWLVTLAIVAIDPFDMYPWGVRLRMEDRDYSFDAIPFALDVATKESGTDAFLIGASTEAGFTRSLLSSLLPGIHHPQNLSYNGPRTPDRALVDQLVLQNAHPKRVLLALDVPYYLTGDHAARLNASSRFPSYLYDDTPVNDVRMIGATAIRLAFAELRGKGFWLPEWGKSDDEKRGAVYAKFQSARSRALLARQIAQIGTAVAARSGATCSDFTSLANDLVPFARQLSARHIALDLFFPPLSKAAYASWLATPRAAASGPTIFSDGLLFRQCAVDALSDIPGVRIFAFDNEDWITSDLSNYEDVSHLYNESIFAYMLRQMANGRNRLTKANVRTENARLLDGVLKFRLKPNANEVSAAHGP